MSRDRYAVSFFLLTSRDYLRDLGRIEGRLWYFLVV